MNCEQYTTFLNDYIDGSLTDELARRHEKHGKQCVQCQALYQEALSLQQLLQDYPVPEPDDGFEARMLKVLDQKEEPKEQTLPQQKSGPHWVTSLIGGALAASIFMWIFFVPGNFTNETGMEQITVSLPYQQRKDVQLVFNSPIKVSEAHFSITLPDNVEIVGRPGVHQLSWQGKILNGSNRLTLPLVAQGKVSGELTAKLTSGKSSKTFVIKLKSSSDTSIELKYHNNKTV